jgi:hypothetical protein
MNKSFICRWPKEESIRVRGMPRNEAPFRLVAFRVPLLLDGMSTERLVEAQEGDS